MKNINIHSIIQFILLTFIFISFFLLLSDVPSVIEGNDPQIDNTYINSFQDAKSLTKRMENLKDLSEKILELRNYVETVQPETIFNLKATVKEDSSEPELQQQYIVDIEKKDSMIYDIIIRIPRGPQGPDGPRGEQGIQGKPGKKGGEGDIGESGIG